MDNNQDSNAYRIATLLLIFAAAVSLVAIQLCTKRRFFSFLLLITFRRIEKRSRKTREKQKAATNVMVTSCNEARSNNQRSSYIDNVYAKDLRSIAVSDPTERSEYINQRIPLGNITNSTADEQGIIAIAQEEEIPTTDSSNVEETDAQKHQMHRWNVKQECNEIDEQEQFRFLLLHSLNQRRRRSGVCSSMPSGKVLLSSPRQSLSFKLMEKTNALPELQVNGIHFEGEQVCRNTNTESETPNVEDTTGDGQIQCAIQYNIERKSLVIHSVKVKIGLDPGVPGFIVEVAILPKQNIFEKSQVYSTGKPDVDITLKETFELNCTQTDIEESTLFLVVKPMYSGAVLYAETNLKELTFNGEKEIILGGYLRSLFYE